MMKNYVLCSFLMSMFCGICWSDPNAVPDLYLWLDASTVNPSSPTLWADQTGNFTMEVGAGAAIVEPNYVQNSTINNYPAFQFRQNLGGQIARTGCQTVENASALAGDSNWTIFMVMNPTAPDASGDWDWGGYFSIGHWDDPLHFCRMTEGANQWHLQGAWALDQTSTVPSLDPASGGVLDTPIIVALSKAAGPSDPDHYKLHINGAPNPWVGSYTNVGAYDDVPFTIGQGIHYATGSQYSTANFDLAEIVVCNRVLDDQEKNALGFYFEQKYGIDALYYDPNDPPRTLTVVTSPAFVDTVTPPPGENVFSGGAVVIEASRYAPCPELYEFDHWEGDVVEDPYLATNTIIMDTDKTVTAVFVDTAACGDECRPYPIGDITEDCIVDLEDFSQLAGNWLYCNAPTCP